MDRTVPSAMSEEIKLYRSTLYSLLRSTAVVQIRTLEEVHAGMNSLLHIGARDHRPDISAFIYSLMRLPQCMPSVSTVVLGQDSSVFQRHGYANVEEWQPVVARARRRRCFFDGENVLACYIASRSDIEDVVPVLTAYQIEWNKLHLLMRRMPRGFDFAAAEQNPEAWTQLADMLNIAVDDLNRLRMLWREDFPHVLQAIHRNEKSIGVRLLSGSLSQYMRATHKWFENIVAACPSIIDRPLYFISSNTHSIPNLLTAFALEHSDELVDFIQSSPDADLRNELASIRSKQARSSLENFMYYVMKKYQQTPEGKRLVNEQLHFERARGITRISSMHTFDVEAQVIELNKLDGQTIDPRLGAFEDLSWLKHSDAVLLNIDYPLGLGAYHILSKVTEQVNRVLGIYIMGKAASLNGVRGDVVIPNVLQDEHSHNTYLIQNCFTVSDVAPYLKFGTVLDNQKAITVLGTFLQNKHLMDIFYSEGFADIEMELSNFCSAIYEATRPKRYPMDEIVTLYNIPIDFGALHYISDTPMSKGKNLGAGTLSYYGMDSTYATSVAILRRVIELERSRMK
jgi:hypothetical protein